MGPPPGGGPLDGAPRPPVNGRMRLDWNETVIPVGKGDEGFDVSPDGAELWTANAHSWFTVDHRPGRQESGGDTGRENLWFQSA